jgi:hypothetical protein
LTESLNPLLQRKAGLDQRQRVHQAMLQQSKGSGKGAAWRAYQPDLFVRTITENCSTLKFSIQGYEREKPET